MSVIYDVVIIGAGPAGLTAGIYTGRSGLNTLILERQNLGGELVNRDIIENYPGYPEGIKGPNLAANMVSQAMDCGVTIELGEVTGVMIDAGNNVVTTASDEYQGRGLIIATGAHVKKLGVPGELELADRGVFYCGTCDGPRFAGKVVAVAGGGDSALTEAIYLTKLASKVLVVHRRKELRAAQVLQERAMSNSNLEFLLEKRIESIRGDDRVTAIDIVDTISGETSTIQVDGVLVRAGVEPNTTQFSDVLALDRNGYALANVNMETDSSGIFVAGDIRHDSPMQISTAVGDGATAALSVRRYIQELIK